MGGRRRLEWVARGASLGLAMLVPASAVGALVLHAVRAAEVPSRSDWKRAAAAVRSSARPGDKIVFAPGWAQEGRGLFAGLDAIPQERWGEDEVAGAARVFVVASFGASPPRWLRDRAQVESDQRFGNLRVVRLKLEGGATRVFDFTASIARAQVSLRFKDRTLSCPRRGERHECDTNRYPWRWVGASFVRIGGKSRRCIWAHPTTNATLEIGFPTARMGRTLALAQGISDAVAARGAPVRMEVRVAGERLVTIELPRGRGWRRSRIDTSRWQGQNVPITFAVTTPIDGARHFCFAAEAVE